MRARTVDEGQSLLLRWFEPRRTAYPWRGGEPDPYRVLVSEVMLQQTQAIRVIPAFASFVERFPTVRALADVPRSAVMRAWDGLGYNRRAVALSEAARRIVRDHDGMVPRDPTILRRLPGVGPYTAAAVASIGFGVPVAAVDTNVRRVVARAVMGVQPSETSTAGLGEAATDWLVTDDPAGWNQAVMDLGRTVCRPVPRCPECPIVSTCRFVAAGSPAATPAGRRQGSFEGSTRQARGMVVRVLRRRPAPTLRALAVETGLPFDRLRSAVRSLARDGVVVIGPAGAAGRPAARVRLAD